MATDALMLGRRPTRAVARRDAWPRSTPPCRPSGATPTPSTSSATPRRSATAWPSSPAARIANVQGILVLLTPQAMTDPTETARQMQPFAHLPNKPLLACWMGGSAVRPGVESAQCGRHSDLRRAGVGHPRLSAHGSVSPQSRAAVRDAAGPAGELTRRTRRRVRQIFQQVRGSGRTLLTEVESKEVLAAYGMPVVPAVACDSADEAVAAARKIGYPVVLKLLSSTITHKSDVGGVQLNLADEKAVRAAFATIRGQRCSSRQAGRLRGRVGAGDDPRARLRADYRQLRRSPVWAGDPVRLPAAFLSRSSRTAPSACRRSTAPWRAA